MRTLFPGFVSRVTKEGVVWHGTLRPTEDSPTYAVKVTYRARRAPRVFVQSPRLRPGAPHLYKDGSLCLYWPAEWRWTAMESMAETIIPWAALWLFYYELWIVTGEWLGPSSPHNTDTKANRPVAR